MNKTGIYISEKVRNAGNTVINPATEEKQVRRGDKRGNKISRIKTGRESRKRNKRNGKTNTNGGGSAKTCTRGTGTTRN